MSTASDMRIFVQVVESSSFSTAAAALGLTPSAVSKIVTKLEDRLGVRLLHRTTRRLALTMEGELYFARARQIVSDIADAETEVARVHGVPRGRIRVATSAAFGVSQLAPILPDFLQRYPEISVDLSLTDRVVDLVDEQIDVAIRAGRLTDATLIARQIATYRRVICAAPAYLARKGTPRNPADLAGHDVISVVTPSGAWPFRSGGEIVNVALSPRVVTDSSDAALHLAIAGGGIARLAEIAVMESIRNGRLVAIMADVHHAERLPLSAVYLLGRHRLPKLRAFLDFMVERFSPEPWQLLNA